MRSQKIPTAQARTFSDSKEALGYCDEVRFPVVIKADGLALGKGVVIAPDVATAKSTIEAMMNEARFGDAGRRIVIEEFLRGSECSFTRSSTARIIVCSNRRRDHKRAFDGDKGPNTGGMGAFSPATIGTRSCSHNSKRKLCSRCCAVCRKRNRLSRSVVSWIDDCE